MMLTKSCDSIRKIQSEVIKMIRVKSLFYNTSGHGCAVIADANGQEHRLEHGDFVNIRTSDGIKNGRVFEIGHGGFDFTEQIYTYFVPWYRIIDIWNIH